VGCKEVNSDFGRLAGIALVILCLTIGMGSCAFLCNSRMELRTYSDPDKRTQAEKSSRQIQAEYQQSQTK